MKKIKKRLINSFLFFIFKLRLRYLKYQINKQLEISNKIASSKLVIDTIESNTIKSLTDKQLESITPIATDKIKSIHKNIYDS